MAMNKKGIFVTITVIVLLLILIAAFSTYTKQSQDKNIASERIKTNTFNSFVKDINNHLVPEAFEMTLDYLKIKYAEDVKKELEDDFEIYIKDLLENDQISIKNIAKEAGLELTFSNYKVAFTPQTNPGEKATIYFEVSYFIEDKEKTISWIKTISITKILDPKP